MDQIDRLLGCIDASFEGALARDEEIAADDLALSYRQGRSLRDALARAGGLRLVRQEASPPVTFLGSDYLGLGEPTSSLVPLRHAIVSCHNGSKPPRQLEETWIQQARDWRGSAVIVGLATSSTSGILDLVGPDHLLVTAENPVFIPAEEVRFLSLAAESGRTIR